MAEREPTGAMTPQAKSMLARLVEEGTLKTKSTKVADELVSMGIADRCDGGITITPAGRFIVQGAMSIDADVAAWRASGTTGASADAIVDRAMTGTCDGSYPHDASDFGRCERAMDMIAGLRDRLPLMSNVNAYWAKLVPAWDNIRAAGDQTQAIRDIIKPIEDADPCHVRISGTASIKVGRSKTLTAEQVGTMKAADRKNRSAPPVKNTSEDRAVEDKAYGVAADELRQFIEQFEQLVAEKQDISEQQKAVMAEAKARGYDTKVMRMIIALRRRDKDDIAEEEATLDMYKAALGMV